MFVLFAAANATLETQEENIEFPLRHSVPKIGTQPGAAEHVRASLMDSQMLIVGH
jgi:hypothetical protein